jgi:hypothetical protein
LYVPEKKKDATIMVVCAHGEVAVFCEKHNIEILESYSGDLESYRGSCAVIVTDQQMTREQYESLKCSMFIRGQELISTEWTDDAVILALLRQAVENSKKHGGRNPFGFRKKKGELIEIPAMMEVARRIIEMRDAGYTWEYIRNHDEIRHANGEMIGLSTIQKIVDNREKYERK